MIEADCATSIGGGTITPYHIMNDMGISITITINRSSAIGYFVKNHLIGDNNGIRLLDHDSPAAIGCVVTKSAVTNHRI